MAGDGFPGRTNSYHAVRTSHRMKALDASNRVSRIFQIDPYDKYDPLDLKPWFSSVGQVLKFLVQKQ